MTLSTNQLAALTQNLLSAAGLTPDHVATVSDIFVRASLRNVGHHDIYFLPQRLDWLTHHGVNPRPNFQLEHSFGATEVWDADHGLGEAACAHITHRAIELSRAHGIGFATIKRSNHFLAASPYCEIGAEAGCLLLVFSNTDPCMAAPGGNKNVIGNNPLGFGLPRENGQNLILDICMAYSSLGNLRTYAKAGQTVPEHWGKNAAGQPTTDPAAILNGGAVMPMAGHKGFGLSLLTESLTGLLSGGATTNQVTAGGGINTHNQTVIALDLARFGGAPQVAHRAEDMVTRLKADGDHIRIPGEKSHQERLAIQEGGLTLDAALIDKLRDWHRHFGLPMPF